MTSSSFLRTRTRLVTVAAIAVGVLVFGAVPAFASVWGTGDIFVGVADGNYNVYSNSGTFKETINAGSGFTTGCAFNNDQSQLFTTYFDDGTVEAFNTPHPHASALFTNDIASPESVAFDHVGNVYVSTGYSRRGFYKYNSSGTLLQLFAVGTRVDWLDLAADQKTIFYTNGGSAVHRWDTATNTPLPDFAHFGGAFALRILPDGGLLVANGDSIHRFNAAGILTQAYARAGNDFFFALNLDPNGTSFWSADIGTGDVVKFNIASGAVEDNFNTGTGSSTVHGLCLKGEITVGGGDTTPPTCALIATIPGPPKSIQVEVQDTGSGIASIQHSETNAVTVVPAFAPGTTAPVVIDSTKVVQSMGSTLALKVTDVAGNVRLCDPVVPGSLMRARLAKGHWLSQLALPQHAARVRW